MKGTKRILIVEDDILFLDLLAQALRNRGHIVTTATGVEEAQKALITSDFSLVCSDIHMADETGFELLDYIRATFADLPVILMSSNLTKEDRLQTRIAKAVCVGKTDGNLVDTIINYER